jgi:hypothetical protein
LITRKFSIVSAWTHLMMDLVALEEEDKARSQAELTKMGGKKMV